MFFSKGYRSIQLQRRKRSESAILIFFPQILTFLYCSEMRFLGSEELSLETIRRVHELEMMKTYLASTTDDYQQLPNIEALLEAYKSGELDWNTGLVTYWLKGTRISQPRPFDWDEFEAINSHYQDYKGFWVEGVIDLFSLLTTTH